MRGLCSLNSAWLEPVQDTVAAPHMLRRHSYSKCARLNNSLKTCEAKAYKTEGIKAETQPQLETSTFSPLSNWQNNGKSARYVTTPNAIRFKQHIHNTLPNHSRITFFSSIHRTYTNIYIIWHIKQTSTKLKEPKSYRVHTRARNKRQKDNREISKHLEIKQWASK